LKGGEEKRMTRKILILAIVSFLVLVNMSVPVKCEISVYVDIKPGSWPNPIYLGSIGVFSVAICGTEDFDAASARARTHY